MPYYEFVGLKPNIHSYINGNKKRKEKRIFKRL